MAQGSQGVRDAFGYLSVAELDELKRLINDLPPKSICVNIGAGSGTSGLAFIESPQVGTLYTIDLFRKGRPEGALENELNAFRDSGFLYDTRYHQIQGDSTDIGKHWDKGKVDMVFIDGNHTYEHCRSDILAWLPRLKSGGMMIIHDYQTKVWPGVERATKELMFQKPTRVMISKVDSLISFMVI